MIVKADRLKSNGVKQSGDLNVVNDRIFQFGERLAQNRNIQLIQGGFKKLLFFLPQFFRKRTELGNTIYFPVSGDSTRVVLADMDYYIGRSPGFILFDPGSIIMDDTGGGRPDAFMGKTKINRL